MDCIVHGVAESDMTEDWVNNANPTDYNKLGIII